MEDLTIDELKQLVVFYRNRAIDLETQLLSYQLKSTRVQVVEDTPDKPSKNK